MALIIAALMPALISAALSATAAVAEITAMVASYISTALAGLSVAARAAVTASVLASVITDASAGGGISEICRSVNEIPSGFINGRECLYSCPSGATVEGPSRVRTVCGGAQERICPPTIAR